MLCEDLEAGEGGSRGIVCISTCQCQRHRDAALIPVSGRSSGVENGNPLKYACLENSMDRGAWWATVYGVARVGHDLGTKPPRFQISREWQTNQSSTLRELAFQWQLELITTPRV